LRNTKLPVPSVTVSSFRPVPVLVAVTATPGSAAFCGSVTCPMIDP